MLGRVLLAGTVLLAVTVPSAAAYTPPRCTINGSATGDTLVGTGRSDVICGHRGDDLIIGGGGRDVLRGGKGSDVLNARDGQGGDWLIGANGLDTCIADDTDHVDATCDRVFDKTHPPR